MKTLLKQLPAGEKSVLGFGMDRVESWRRRVVSRYVQARTQNGNLGACHDRIDSGSGSCRL